MLRRGLCLAQSLFAICFFKQGPKCHRVKSVHLVSNASYETSETISMTSTLSTSSMPAIDNTHLRTATTTEVPERLLLGPGPSNSHPNVVAAMNYQPIGHLDPAYLDLMDEVQSLLRYAWQTSNQMTLPVSGTGSAAMEATLANTVEPGDVVLVGVNGYFGHRMMDMAERYRIAGEKFKAKKVRK